MAEINIRKRGDKWRCYFEGTKVDVKGNEVIVVEFSNAFLQVGA